VFFGIFWCFFAIQTPVKIIPIFWIFFLMLTPIYSQFQMLIFYRRLWPQMTIFSSMLWLNRQHSKLLWVEWSSGRICWISKHISFKKSRAYKSERKIMCKKGFQKNSLRIFQSHHNYHLEKKHFPVYAGKFCYGAPYSFCKTS
jgi:hypothetical protein